ncbi:unnamed protein product [Cyclocybe aegerita]|uniref:B30.2/SPRY domain-containing protein n=1 Tax=Cyclocybe aegerita TaxID=1973307 RepID=A0A8S0WH14_CYCAE|nr:unnamed protein product [Cyclocybe aegerita]
MGFLRSLKGKLKENASSSSHSGWPGSNSSAAPPEWAAAPEVSHTWGKWNEAPGEEYDAAQLFCRDNPVNAPRLLPSLAVDRIAEIGCRAWGIEVPESPRFVGRVQNIGEAKGNSAVVTVQTQEECKDVCLLSDLPIVAGLYDVQGKTGVYYEVCIRRMNGIIAVGTACKPHPAWRLPGWDRLSAGFHLDDFRKFFEDPDGGRDYLPPTSSLTRIRPGDIIGCGYEFASGALFFTYNGARLPNAFTGIYLPRHAQDVFAAVGVEGRCEFEVNFGGDMFRWKEGNEWAWRVEGHVGRMVGSSRGDEEELPSYQEARIY